MSPLQDFQSTLIKGVPARVSPEIALDVLQSISYLYEISGAEFARQAGVSKVTGNNYLQGERSPSFCRLVRMLDRLGFDISITARRET